MMALVAGTLRDAGSIAAIVGASIATILLLASIAKSWRRKRRRRRFAAFLHEGNELQVRLNGIDPNDTTLAELLEDMDRWFGEVQKFVEKHNTTLVPVLRSDSGIAQAPGHDPRSYRVVWLPQRIKQMEKVFREL